MTVKIMQMRSPIRISRQPSYEDDTTPGNSESMSATLASFFKSRSFRFPKSTSRKMLTGKKSVSFAPLVRVIHVQSYKEDMKQELWYSREDIQMIKKNNSILVNQYKHGCFFESSINTFFGLEQYLILEETRYKRECLYDAVLGLQDRCKDKCHPSVPEQIAKVCQNVFCH